MRNVTGVLAFTGIVAAACLALTAGHAVAAPKAAPSRPKVLVYDLKAERGVQESLANLLNATLLEELSADVDVIGRSDIGTLLGVEQQKQLLGCDGGDSCLVEIGGMLGAPWVVSGRFGLIDRDFSVYLTLLDTQRGRVALRASETVPGTERHLAWGIRKAARRLVQGVTGKVPEPIAAPASVEGSPSSTASPRSIARWGGVVAGAGLAIAGAVAYGLPASRVADAVSRSDARSVSELCSAGVAADACHSRLAWTANGVVAGGLVLGLASWLLLGPPSDAGAGGDAGWDVAVAPQGVAVGGRW